MAPLKVLPTPRNKFEVTINEWSMNVAYRNLEADPGRVLSTSAPLSICSRIMPQRKTSARGIRSGRSTTGDFCFARRKGLHCRFLGSLKQLRPSSYVFLRRGEQRINFSPLLYGSGPFAQLPWTKLWRFVVRVSRFGRELGEVTLPGKKYSQPWTKGFRQSNYC